METRTREINADTERLHQRLRDIAQSVLNDEDDVYTGEDTGRQSPRRLSPLRGADRFDSPERAYTRYVIYIFCLVFNVKKSKTTNFFPFVKNQLNSCEEVRTLLFDKFQRTRRLLGQKKLV